MLHVALRLQISTTASHFASSGIFPPSRTPPPASYLHMDRGPGSLASPHSNRRALRGCQRELVRKNRLPLDFPISAPSSWAKIAFRRYDSYLRRLLHLLRMLLAFLLPRSHHRRLLPKVRPSARRRRYSNNIPADPSPHDWAVGLLLRREILRHPLRRRSPPSLRPRRPLNRRRSQREKPVSTHRRPHLRRGFLAD